MNGKLTELELFAQLICYHCLSFVFGNDSVDFRTKMIYENKQKKCDAISPIPGGKAFKINGDYNF